MNNVGILFYFFVDSSSFFISSESCFINCICFSESFGLMNFSYLMSIPLDNSTDSIF